MRCKRSAPAAAARRKAALRAAGVRVGCGSRPRRRIRAAGAAFRGCRRLVPRLRYRALQLPCCCGVIQPSGAVSEAHPQRRPGAKAAHRAAGVGVGCGSGPRRRSGGWRRLSRVPQARSSPALPRATILRISMRSASTVVRGKRSAPAAAARRKSSAPRCRGWCWVRLRAKAAHPGGWRRLSRCRRLVPRLRYRALQFCAYQCGVLQP